ncbi:ribosome maturation factor RimP [Helicobacter sp. MIT 03-1614]|uniref:ribosome maturation factor RimP n=1 Tax=Helicobacter sp. MIT 03-1614 TaxID=1548147 RepID=UPI000513277C|nr:ribosome maturation factor RimP [Helicobacter sp. MIT 03-1614]TLD90447.1 ribosome maturation factor RimP [Helicobacter sp. MIT 03-1614]
MLSQHTQARIEQLAATLGLYIYDIDFLKEDNRPILRVSITRKAPMQKQDCKNGLAVSLQDCQNVSELISPLLDVEDENLKDYNLEVSSPGLERVLKKPQHYIYSLGEKVSIKLMDKSVIEGILHDVNENVSISIDTGKEILSFSFADMKKIKVVFEL